MPGGKKADQHFLVAIDSLAVFGTLTFPVGVRTYIHLSDWCNSFGKDF
tara:strand:- start:32862 stop:33005 length:144 start_codon:yes stop_codon:yes gene_type:complete